MRARSFAVRLGLGWFLGWASISHAAVNAYWGDGERGWFWYEDPVVESPEDSAPKVALPKPDRNERPAPTKPPEVVEFERLQKRLDEYRKIAIVSPTESNVRRYMEAEAEVVSKASYFADVAQRVAWASPDLDQTLKGRPVNAKALEVFEHEQAQVRAQSVAELGQEHVLFFFFRGDCPYCYAYAPILRAFQDKYGIGVVAVSLDGGALPEFPAPRMDNGVSRTLNVTQVPATFIAHPLTGKITPIGFGVLSEADLLERVSIVTTSASESMAPSATRRISLE